MNMHPTPDDSGQTREERDRAHLKEHGDGMDNASRLELVRQVARLIEKARQSISVAIDSQVITYSYPTDTFVRSRHGGGVTITIDIDGGGNSGHIGQIPAGTFLEKAPSEDEAAPTAAAGPTAVDTASGSTEAHTGATDASRGDNENEA